MEVIEENIAHVPVMIEDTGLTYRDNLVESDIRLPSVFAMLHKSMQGRFGVDGYLAT
jgi:hypothetical protein